MMSLGGFWIRLCRFSKSRWFLVKANSVILNRMREVDRDIVFADHADIHRQLHIMAGIAKQAS